MSLCENFSLAIYGIFSMYLHFSAYYDIFITIMMITTTIMFTIITCRSIANLTIARYCAV